MFFKYFFISMVETVTQRKIAQKRTKELNYKLVSRCFKKIDYKKY